MKAKGTWLLTLNELHYIVEKKDVWTFPLSEYICQFIHMSIFQVNIKTTVQYTEQGQIW